MSIVDQFNLELTDDLKLAFAKEAGEFDRTGAVIGERLRVGIGVARTEEMLRRNSNMRDSMDAMLTSIVLESWLFFEALCSDLWVATVDNAGPVISARIELFDKWEKSEMLATSVTISNAKTQRGSFKREIGQVSFQKLRNLKNFGSYVAERGFLRRMESNSV